MEKMVSVVAILILALFLSSLTRGQRIIQIPPPRPLCSSQYALANYACSRLPMNTVPPPSPISPPPPPPPPIAPPPPDHDDHDDHDDDDDHNHDDHDHDDHNNSDRDHHKDNDSSQSRRQRRHRHHHHHHHHRHSEETYAQQECCKWLKLMDNECVCDILVQLPPLLAKPVHNYTVFVDESCIVTYTCGGRLIS
ncbi:unnamed protein product [Cochlearia groenlandica]